MNNLFWLIHYIAQLNQFVTISLPTHLNADCILYKYFFVTGGVAALKSNSQHIL